MEKRAFFFRRMNFRRALALPALSADLIKYLDGAYPALTPDDVLSQDRKALAFAAGQRSVIDHLVQLQKEDEATDFVQQPEAEGTSG